MKTVLITEENNLELKMEEHVLNGAIGVCTLSLNLTIVEILMVTKQCGALLIRGVRHMPIVNLSLNSIPLVQILLVLQEDLCCGGKKVFYQLE
jgi:hypothetical protein